MYLTMYMMYMMLMFIHLKKKLDIIHTVICITLNLNYKINYYLKWKEFFVLFGVDLFGGRGWL
jgi:hypothetical protein